MLLNICLYLWWSGYFQAFTGELWTVEADVCGHLTLIKGGIYPPPDATSVRRHFVVRSVDTAGQGDRLLVNLGESYLLCAAYS